MTGLFIGLMSGTSLDGVDGVLASISEEGQPSLMARAAVAMPAELRDELLALNTPLDNELHRAAMASNALVDLYASVVHCLLDQSTQTAAAVRAIGAHGQTVRHQPALGYTLQLNAPARLAELTGIDVIADFRSRDVAAGGQGAPLVPAFHQAVFGTEQPRVILNLGGIANVTLLRPGQPALGFDTGPANLLMDAWCQTHTGQAFDRDGAWGATGRVDTALLSECIASEPWFDRPPPKSTGRDLFGMGWLQARLLRTSAAARAPQDVQATLQALTVKTVVSALARQGLRNTPIYVCGGGAQNGALMAHLSSAWGGDVASTAALGIPPQDVEALAFAWLAWAHVQKKTGNLPEVTGAIGGRLLGACWPA